MIDLAVVGILVCENKTLLLHRTFAPICWTPPGGHVEANETLIDAVHREVYEETGIRCRIIMPIDIWHGEHDAIPIESISFVCECDTSVVRLSNEHDDFRWVDIAEIENWKHATDFDVSKWDKFFKTAMLFKNLMGDTGYE